MIALGFFIYANHMLHEKKETNIGYKSALSMFHGTAALLDAHMNSIDIRSPKILQQPFV
jgi:hypothetical protein